MTKHLGKRLQAMREGAGLSVRQAELLVHVSSGVIAALESCQTPVISDLIKRLLAFYNADLTDLMSENVWFDTDGEAFTALRTGRINEIQFDRWIRFYRQATILFHERI